MLTYIEKTNKCGYTLRYAPTFPVYYIDDEGLKLYQRFTGEVAMEWISFMLRNVSTLKTIIIGVEQ